MTPEFVTFRQDLAAKGVRSGMKKARELVKTAKDLDLSPEDKNYLESQLVVSVYRLDRADEKMKSLGFKSQEKSDTTVQNPWSSFHRPTFGWIGEESNKRLEVIEQGTEVLAAAYQE